MRRQPKKRAALIRIYLKRREIFLINNPWCIRCGGTADQIHHKAGRLGGALIDESKWASTCGPCHQYITEHPAEAYANGWSLRRIEAAS